jgi:hypothetical protein
MIVLAGVVIAGCSDDDATSSAETVAIETSENSAATTAVATPPTSESSSTVADDVASACPTEGGTDPSASATFTISASQAVTGVQADVQECYEDVTVRFTGGLTDQADFPGWSAEYVDQPVEPLTGEPFTLEAESVLVFRVGASMSAPADEGSAMLIDLEPDNTTHILHVKGFDDADGQSAVAVGLDAEYPYSVIAPDGPPRLIVRFFTG